MPLEILNYNEMKNKQILKNYLFNEEENEFSNCVFEHGNYSEFHFDSFEFHDCVFHSFDLSMATFQNAVLSGVEFIQCKLLGIDFSVCSKFTFSVSFDQCMMNYCFFNNNKLKSTQFHKCEMIELNILESDLEGSIFKECDLTRTVFDQCNLIECDFRGAYNYSIHPEHNKIKKAMFSYPGVLGLLGHYDIIVD